MSQRERTLALAAGALLPIAGMLFGFMWLMSTLNGYDEQIAAANSQLNQAKLLQRNQVAATRRLKTYKTLSLASDPQHAVAEYRNWLIDVSDRIFGKNVPTYETPTTFSEQSKFRDPARPTQPVRKVLNGWRVKINVAEVTLDQLNRFLFEFYRAPILHRIKNLVITPLAGRPGATTGNLPTGKLGLLLEIEAIALTDAAADQGISPQTALELPHDLAWYQQHIEHRNIFGLPNKPPQITTGNQSEFEGRDIAFNISARDEDENDQVTFELLSTDVPGAALNQRDPTSKSAQFTAGQVPVGKYTLRVRVTDSGLPHKNVEKEIALEVKAKEPEAIAKPKPRFDNARETQVTAVVRENDGVDRVWIYVRTLDEQHKLAVGESFELDGKKWSVVQIEPRAVVLECEGQPQTFRVGDKLASDDDPDRAPRKSAADDADGS